MASGDPQQPPRKDEPQGAGATARRRLVGKANLWMASLLFAAVLFMVNYLSYRHFERWDWTGEGRFTVSDRTEQVLAELTQPIDVYIFLSRGEVNFDDVRELTERYRAQSEHVRVHYVDPDRRPSEFRQLMSRFGLRAAQLETGEVVADLAGMVAAGDKHWRITRNDLLSLDFDSFDTGRTPQVDVKAERALTGAILQVTQGRPTKVCLTRGHGEWSLEGGGERSLWALEEELKRNNVEMEAVDTLGTSQVPEGCDALFVIGPLRAFGEKEAELLKRHVQGGGDMLLTLDPLFDREGVLSTGLEDMLRDFGIELDRTVVLERDRARQVGGSPLEPFLVTQFGDHPTMRALAAMQGRVLVHLARSVRPAEGERAVALLETSEKAFAVTDVAAIDPSQDLAPGPSDMEGPLALAAAVELDKTGEGEGRPRGGRLVVVGDTDWLSSELMQLPQFANVDLASAITGWLTEREALISIAPRKAEAAAFMLTDEDVSNLGFRVLGLMPAAVLMLGFAVWWSRRA
jgi:ABC-2 type transport system permease protein